MPEPVIKQPDSPLLTKDDLRTWLRLTPWEVRKLTSDPEFLKRCAINVGASGAKYRNLRFIARAVAEFRGIPEYATPQLAAAPVEVAA